MNKLYTVIFFALSALELHAQNFDKMVQDPDSICGVTIINCNQQGHHGVDYDNLSRIDSLTCTETSHYFLDDSKNVLCVERNFYGDTLAIGLKAEKGIKERWSFFKRPYLKTSSSLFGLKKGEWYYYFPDGHLKEIKKH